MPSTTELALPSADSNGYVSASVQDNVHEELQARYEITNTNVSVENEEDIICAPCKTSHDTLPELPLGASATLAANAAVSALAPIKSQWSRS